MQIAIQRRHAKAKQRLCIRASHPGAGLQWSCVQHNFAQKPFGKTGQKPRQSSTGLLFLQQDELAAARRRRLVSGWVVEGLRETVWQDGGFREISSGADYSGREHK